MSRNAAPLILTIVLVGITPSLTLGQGVDDVNGLVVATGVVKGDPNTVVTIDTANYPELVSIDERDFTNMGIGFEANRNDLQFSSDGGDTPRPFHIGEAFDISVDVTLHAGSAAPPKEAGLRIDLIGFDGVFYVNTETGEIAALGTVVPFFSFTAAAGAVYEPGRTINMRMAYTPPTFVGGEVTPGSMEYIIDNGFGPITSTALPFTNDEGGLLSGSLVAVYEQAIGDGSNPADFVTATFADFDFHGTLSAMPTGDFDADGDVDGADFLTWQRGLGLSGAAATNAAGNANGDTIINGADLTVWKNEFGTPAVAAASAVPEPSAAALLLIAAAGFAARRTATRSVRRLA